MAAAFSIFVSFPKEANTGAISNARQYQTLMTDKTPTEVSSAGAFNPFERLREIAKLHKNWDSYDAVPSSEHAISKTTTLLFSSGKMAPYWLAPLPDGGIHLEWRSRNRILQVIVSADGSTGYLEIVGVDNPTVRPQLSQKPAATLQEIEDRITSTLG